MRPIITNDMGATLFGLMLDDIAINSALRCPSPPLASIRRHRWQEEALKAFFSPARERCHEDQREVLGPQL